MPIRVLIVDDSAPVRTILSQGLARDPELEIVGTAPDPFVARDLIVTLKPDVITLDMEMPRMDGLTFLRKLMHYYPLPVIVITSASNHGQSLALSALEAGALDFLCKPVTTSGWNILCRELIGKLKEAPLSHIRAIESRARQAEAAPLASRGTHGRIVAIGSSTGGTRALERILPQWPANGPATLIVQHMPAGFTRSFADRLNRSCAAQIKEAADGDLVQPGQILIAPGNYHMLLQRSSGNYRVKIKDGPQVCHQRPSVDVLFSSVARSAGAKAIGVILTGMGNDGAEGLYEMHQAGASTIAQDEASCAIFGMPRVAIERGAVDHVLPLERIPSKIFELD